MMKSRSPAGVEVDLRRRLRTGGCFEGHLGLGAVDDLRADRVGESSDRRVIFLNRLVVVAAGDEDRVLGSLDLRLEGEKVLVRLKVGVGLDRRQQPAERSTELGLSGI